MSITYVGGKTANTAGTTSSFDVSLTDLSGGIDTQPSTGDLVLIGYAVGTTGGSNYDEQMTGYTRHQDLFESESTFNANLAVYYKFMGGTPDTTATFPPTGTLARAGAITIQVFRGVLSSVFDVTTTTNTADNFGRPTPPPITPSSEDSVIVCIGSASHNNTFTNGQLSNFLTDAGSDTYNATIGSGIYEWTSGTFTPSQFGGGSTSDLYAWCAVTMVLKASGYDFTQQDTTTLTDTRDVFIGKFVEAYDFVSLTESSSAKPGVDFSNSETLSLLEVLAKIAVKWTPIDKNVSSWTEEDK